MTHLERGAGLSVRLKLTLSYAGFLMVAGLVLLTAVWVFLLRYVPTTSEVSAYGNLGPSLAGPSRDDLLRAFVPKAAWALVLLLVLGLLGGWVLAGRMLAPLARITNATRAAAAGRLSHRIELEGRDDEFRELADSFDTMLARLEAQVAEQQRFAANASHELRTPLAITQTLLDVARSDPNRDSHQLDERLRAVNARAIDLTEALLLLSRVDHRSFVRERVDVSLLAEEAVETLLPLAERQGVAIEASGEVAFTTGSPALLLQLTTNLLHNAVVHNRQAGGTARVGVTATPESALLVVENTGEPLTPEVTASLTEPFHRGNERIRGDHGGVGLGLAIVKSITAAHDGALTLTPLASGGLRVTVRLPSAPTQEKGPLPPR